MRLFRLSHLGFLSACCADASAQDPQVLDLKNPFTLPSQLVRRVVSANQSWRGYLRAMWTGHGSYREYGGASYTGQVRGFPFVLKHGQGTYIRPDGTTRYEGEFKEGLANGKGVLTTLLYGRYQGEFKKGLANGKGVATYANDDQYEGEFEAGLPHGQGVLIYHEGPRHKARAVQGLVKRIEETPPS